MKSILRIISLSLCLFLLSSCCFGGASSSSKTVQYECNHGLLNQELYKTGLKYNGNPVELDYAFNNVNMDSNFGLMLFLNGIIQPFTLDNETESNIQIVELSTGTINKTVHISFDPIIGKSGENLQLNIIAIFDAGSNYNTPTLAPAFYHSLSQSLPVSLYMGTNSSNTTQTLYNSQYYCNFSNNSPTLLSDETCDDIIFSDEAISLDETFEFSLINTSEIDADYYIYAYINNTPIKINEQGLFLLACPAKSKISVTSKLLGNSIGKDDVFYIIAVPHQTETTNYFQSTLKTKTIPLSVTVKGADK